MSTLVIRRNEKMLYTFQIVWNKWTRTSSHNVSCARAVDHSVSCCNHKLQKYVSEVETQQADLKRAAAVVSQVHNRSHQLCALSKPTHTPINI
eukprot:4338845-Amphidinium_carterae.1